MIDPVTRTRQPLPIVRLLLATATLATPALAQSPPAVEMKPPVLVTYGGFYRYAFGDKLELGYVVYQPKVPAPNGAGIIAIDSGGSNSHAAIDILGNNVPSIDYEAAARPYLERGYTVFVLTHGNPTSYPSVIPDSGRPTPGFTLQEIFCQIHRGARCIKRDAAYFGVDADRIASTGASSGAALALALATGGLGSPSQPFYEPSIDGAISSRVTSCAFTVGGGDSLNFRGPGDQSWACRSLENLFHPDFTAFGYPPPPAPPCASIQARFATTGGYGVAGRPVIDGNEVFFRFFPEADYINPSLTYPKLSDPTSLVYCQSLFDDFDSYAPVNNMDALVGPILGFNAGPNDRFVAPHQKVGLENAASAAAVPELTIREFPNQSHSMIDPRKELIGEFLDFFDRTLLGVADYDKDDLPDALEPATKVEADSDGDLVSDFVEHVGGTNPTDGTASFRVTQCSAIADAAQSRFNVTISFDCGANGMRSYVLQSATRLSPLPDWEDVRDSSNQLIWVKPAALVNSAQLMTTIAFNPASATCAELGSRYFRVRATEDSGAFTTAHTHPAVVHLSRVSRRLSPPDADGCWSESDVGAIGSRTNYVIPPVWEAPIHCWRPIATDFVGNDQVLVNRAFPANLGSLGGKYMLVVLRDGNHVNGLVDPLVHGDEGRWWRIDSTSTPTTSPVSIQVKLRYGQSNLQSSIPAGSTLGIVPLPTLKTLFGPLPAATSGCADAAMTRMFPIGPGDRVFLFNNRAHNTPGNLPSAFETAARVVARNPSTSQFEWAILEASGNLVFSSNDGSKTRFYPDEVVQVAACARPFTSSYFASAGIVPLSSIDAYLLRPNSPTDRWLNVPGWPFPESTRLFEYSRSSLRTDSELVACGFRGVAPLLMSQAPTGGDIIRMADPNWAHYDGDSGLTTLGLTPDGFGYIHNAFVTSGDEYYKWPPHQTWVVTFGGVAVDVSSMEEALIPGFPSNLVQPRQLNQLLSGRGVELWLEGDPQNRIMRWTRPLPYSLD